MILSCDNVDDLLSGRKYVFEFLGCRFSWRQRQSFGRVASKLITLTLLFLRASYYNQPVVPTPHLVGTNRTVCTDTHWPEWVCL